MIFIKFNRKIIFKKVYINIFNFFEELFVFFVLNKVCIIKNVKIIEIS